LRTDSGGRDQSEDCEERRFDMRGYDVITSDGEKLGHVVGTDGSMLLVERGTIRKSRYAVPRAMAQTDQAENEVRLSVSRQVVEEGPRLDGEGVDEKAVADYYGLGEGQERPDTQGYGDVIPGDPARGAEQDAQRMGLESSDEQRVRLREDMRPEEPGPDGPSVGVHGGALFQDSGRRRTKE
jgi:hypothetical protein